MTESEDLKKIRMKHKWIQGAIKKPGVLHQALKVKAGEKIPSGKLKVKEGDTALMKKRKTLAMTLRGLRKG